MGYVIEFRYIILHAIVGFSYNSQIMYYFKIIDDLDIITILDSMLMDKTH